MTEHSWTEDQGRNILVCANCGEWRWSGGEDVKGYYRMRARDSVTGHYCSWDTIGPVPDMVGGHYPGPYSPEDVQVVEKRTMPVAASCDEVFVADVMDS